MSFPRVKVAGGPHGRNLEMTVGDQRLDGVHRVEIVMDVNDVVRMKTFQFVAVDIDTEAIVEAGGIAIIVRTPKLAEMEDPEVGALDTVVGGWETLAEGRGASLKSALLDAADKLP